MHSGIDPVPGSSIAKIGGEVYEKIFPQAYTPANVLRLLSEFSAKYKDRLEQNFGGHAFCIYTMIGDCGKLSRRSIGLIKSDCGYDSATQVYFGAAKPDGPDCLSIVAATKNRQGSITQELKENKQKLRETINEIIIKNVKGKKFNETENKFIATSISKQIKDVIVGIKCKCNYTIGTIILETNVDYTDNVIRTPGQDMETIQVSYRNEEFNFCVFVSFVPLN